MRSSPCATEPRRRAAAPHRWLLSRPYAHRGLHGPAIPENSLPAFAAAIRAGLGIECDVRLSADGVAHVFHDSRLARMTGAPGRIERTTASALARLCLPDGSSIPTLAALLDLATDSAPLLVEIKPGRSPTMLCDAVARVLEGRSGPVAVMSFDARVPGWFAARRRQMARGLVFSGRHHPPHARRRMLALAMKRARPHFLACDVRDLSPVQLLRGWPRTLPLLCWTVRQTVQWRRAARAGAQIIFERG